MVCLTCHPSAQSSDPAVAVIGRAARRTGARLRSGRLEQIRVPLAWRPPSLGTRQLLLPDLVIERPDVVVVIDAKYKRHAEQVARLDWSGVDERLRDEHRDDVLQAPAYSILFDAPRAVSCLAYPAPPEQWAALDEAGRTMARNAGAGERARRRAGAAVGAVVGGCGGAGAEDRGDSPARLQASSGVCRSTPA